MDSSNFTFEDNYKKLGILISGRENYTEVNNPRFKSYIRVLLVPPGYSLSIDFNRHQTSQSTLFFINTNQYLDILVPGPHPMKMIYYNRDFYCIQIHDAEVACDGILFNNVFEIPKVLLTEKESVSIMMLFENIVKELSQIDSSTEEMVRTYLKQLIIHATRNWKKQNDDTGTRASGSDYEFYRNFSRLIEMHFRERHSVSEYADLMGMAPKTLSNKFRILQLDNPNEIIKNRIVLEAKRLLLYSSRSVKEIAYDLGYDDPAYFNRMFTQKTSSSPAFFRKEFGI